MENQRRSPVSFCFYGCSWKRHTWSCCGTWPVFLRTDSWQKQTSSALCLNACSHVRVHTEFALLESFGVSGINDILRVHGHTIVQERKSTIGQECRSKDSFHDLQHPPFLSVPSTTQRNSTVWLCLQKAAHAADESLQQTVQGHNGPTITNPTMPQVEQSGLISQDDDDDSEPTLVPPRKSRLTVPQLHAQLSLLSDRTRLRRENTLCTWKERGSR